MSYGNLKITISHTFSIVEGKVAHHNTKHMYTWENHDFKNPYFIIYTYNFFKIFKEHCRFAYLLMAQCSCYQGQILSLCMKQLEYEYVPLLYMAYTVPTSRV